MRPQRATPAGSLSGKGAGVRLKDKVAVVTGGASGLGEAVVRDFAAAGAKLAILDLNLPRAQAIAEELGIEQIGRAHV